MFFNIFSSFNPINFIFNMSLLTNINFMLFLSFNLFMKKNNFSSLKCFIFKSLKIDFENNNNSYLSMSLIINLMILNLILNIMNLLPYSFCFFSQYYLFLSITLILWISCMMNSLIFYFKKTLVHLTPMGCPMAMSWFMNIIELISMMIRPITLSVRMSANLLAGHLMIHLLSEFSFFLIEFSTVFILVSMMFLIILNILELGVSMIQPYIFYNLTNMYFSENMK